MDLTLTDAERDTILMALWNLKLHTGAVHAAEASLSGEELSNALQYSGSRLACSRRVPPRNSVWGQRARKWCSSPGSRVSLL